MRQGRTDTCLIYYQIAGRGVKVGARRLVAGGVSLWVVGGSKSEVSMGFP